MRMRGEGRKRKKPEQEKCWKNEATADTRSTDPSTNAPKEEIERDMICGIMQMNRGTKTITLHSNQQRGERIAKTKIQQK